MIRRGVIGRGPARRLFERAAGLALVGGLAAGCSSSSAPQRVVTVTRHPGAGPTAHSSAGSSTSSGAGRGTSTPVTSPAPVPSHLTRFRGTCDTLLPEPDVVAAIGGGSVPGVTAFVVGPPEADIGRLAYLNCRYGVTGRGAAAVPKIEIGISLYATAAKAGARIAATKDDYAAHGATGTDTTVRGSPATLLTGGVGTGYAEPLLIAAVGQRTVAVTVSPDVATGARAAADARSLAELALARTGG